MKVLNTWVDILTKMDSEEHKKELLDITNKILNKVDMLPLHAKHKLDIYFKYYMRKISWHLIIVDISNAWIKQHLDTICHNKIRYWLEIPPNGTLDIILLTKAKFGLNVIDVSTKHTQHQVSLRKKLAISENDSVKFVYRDSNISYNMQYSSYKSCKDTYDSKINKIVTNLSSQSLIVKSLWNESFNENIEHWYTSFQNLRKNIYNFSTRYINNTLPTLKNMT